MGAVNGQVQSTGPCGCKGPDRPHGGGGCFERMTGAPRVPEKNSDRKENATSAGFPILPALPSPLVSQATREAPHPHLGPQVWPGEDLSWPFDQLAAAAIRRV